MSSSEGVISTAAPLRERIDPVTWLRRNLFSGWLNTLITIVLAWAIVTVLFHVFEWVLTDATWTPVVVNLRLLMVGRYPGDQLWRVQACVTLVLTLVGLSAGIWRGVVRRLALGLGLSFVLLALVPFGVDIQLWLGGSALLVGLGFLAGRQFSLPLRRATIALWLVSPFVVLLLVRGVGGALPVVDTGLWGGLLLTIILAVIGIVASFPLGVLLALGRRSQLPIVKGFCVGYIELLRGVPLITVLFMALVMLPLFLPPSIRIDNLLRVIVAITLFSAAYLAENVRGGLQAVPHGQVEAARALGLNVFQSTLLIVLPQALRAVIPAIVGQFISLFKDTSLVAIVGLAELLGFASVIINQPEWLTVTGGVEREVLLFTALIYWVFCFTMSKVSQHIEGRLGVGKR